MSINKFNHEGYRDPTVFEALTSIERQEKQLSMPGRYRRLVYICSPYAGDVQNNRRKARRYCRFAVRKFAIPVASHLLFPQFMKDDDPGERRLGMYFATVLLSRCKECWVFGEKISEGMAKEISYAKRRGIPIRYFTEDLVQVWSNGFPDIVRR